MIPSRRVTRTHGEDLMTNWLKNYLEFFQGELNVFLISSVQ